VRVYVRMYVYVYVCIYVYVWICVCLYVCMCLCMYVRMYASMHEWMQKYRTTLNGRVTREKWIEQLWKVMVITEFDEPSRNFSGET